MSKGNRKVGGDLGDDSSQKPRYNIISWRRRPGQQFKCCRCQRLRQTSLSFYLILHIHSINQVLLIAKFLSNSFFLYYPSLPLQDRCSLFFFRTISIASFLSASLFFFSYIFNTRVTILKESDLVSSWLVSFQ